MEKRHSFLKGFTPQFVAAYCLALAGVVIILIALFLPPMGKIDPTVLAAFGELLTFCGGTAGIRIGSKGNIVKPDKTE